MDLGPDVLRHGIAKAMRLWQNPLQRRERPTCTEHLVNKVHASLERTLFSRSYHVQTSCAFGRREEQSGQQMPSTSRPVTPLRKSQRSKGALPLYFSTQKHRAPSSCVFGATPLAETTGYGSRLHDDRKAHAPLERRALGQAGAEASRMKRQGAK